MRTRFTILVVYAMVLTLVPLGQAVATEGYWEIRENTTLTEDHYGQIFVADGMTLNCGPWSIQGDWVEGEEDPGSVGIAAGIGVTIKDCDVSGFTYGIQLFGTSGSTLMGNDSHHNYRDGFSIGFSSGNTLRDNTSSYNGGLGFAVTGDSATGNILVGNAAMGNLWGFLVGERASGNTLKDNYAEGNEDGYQINLSSNNTLKGNRAVNNLAGFVLWDSSLNTLKDNVADGDGAFFFGEQTGVGVVGNVLKGNTGCFSNVEDFKLTNTFKNNVFTCP